MIITVGRKMHLGFGALLALVITIAIVVLFQLDRIDRHFTFVIQHDAPVIANARHLMKLVVDMETGQRGFIITGDENYLEPYNNAVSVFDDLMHEEKVLVSNSPPQVMLLQSIEDSVAEWQEKAAVPEIAIRREIVERPETIMYVAGMHEKGVGKQILDRIRGQFEAFIQEEERLMAQRFGLASDVSNSTSRMISMLAMISVLCGSLVAMIITRGITRPVGRLAEALGLVAKGDFNQKIVVSSTDEIGELSKSFNTMVGELKRLDEQRLRNEDDLRRSSHMMAESLNNEKEAKAKLESAMHRLEVAATTDALTMLPNRDRLMTSLEETIRHAQSDPGFKFAVLFFDFDRFKVINDSLGHNVGDALLCDIADIFRRTIDEANMVARFGGDEFVVLLSGLADDQEAYLVADKLLEAFAEPHTLMGHMVISTASIGLVTNAQSYACASDMLRDADIAMYQAKETGKNQTVVFDKAMHEMAMDRLQLESDLRSAISNDQIHLDYQPIVELDSGEVIGFEALARWEHPTRGSICPTQFIPIAEDSGLIVDIGSWIFRAAAEQIADWNRRLSPGRHMSVNVNVSKRQLLDPNFVNQAILYRQEFGLQPQHIKLEITESIISDDRTDIVSLLHRLRDEGFPIVMDDFGTGASSLSSLHNYPIDVLKIDQSFIRVLDNDRSLLAVVASITSLAENLGIRTVAEGIETQDIVGALQSINCTWGQGYQFARPLTVADAEAYILGVNARERSA